MGWIISAWRGEERLWKVFWIYGVLLSIILTVIQFVALKFGAVANITLLVIRIIYSIWLLVAQWRCAFNAKWTVWSYVIRIFIILGILGFVLGFVFGSSLVSPTAIKALKCGKELQEYSQQGGKDIEEFKKNCLEGKVKPEANLAVEAVTEAVIDKTKIDTPPLPIAPAEALPIAPTEALPIAPAEVDKYKILCQQTMVEYAEKNSANPQQYIDQNQDYLKKCIEYYQAKDAASNNK
jgi:hypothetical protein